MNTFELSAGLMFLSATFSYINHKFIKLPHTVGLMALSITSSLLLLPLDAFFPNILEQTKTIIHNFDFAGLLLNIMLCYLLFAGAFHTNLYELKAEKRSIGFFALFSVVVCVALVGGLLYGVLSTLGFNASIWSCFLFGALISPTDPIAVLGILNKSKMPQRIRTNIVGESLFNDGVGVVIFIVIAEIIHRGAAQYTLWNALQLFAIEAGGGLLFGLVLGFIVHYLLKSIDHYQTELLITLAGVSVGYIIAQHLHISGPLAMVITGLMTGNVSRESAMSHTTETYIEKFWEILDELLNAFLFVLMGIEMLLINVQSWFWGIAVLALIVSLMARYISIIIPFSWIKKISLLPDETPILMTWGGLRGGLSIAMAISIDKMLPERDMWIFTTYILVIFSILVQATTLPRLINHFYKGK